MRGITVVLAALVVTIGAGCSSSKVWVNPNASYAQSNTDHAECQMQARALSPEFISADAWIANAYLTSRKRKGFIEQCMIARGYSAQGQAQPRTAQQSATAQPRTTTRQAPAQSRTVAQQRPTPTQQQAYLAEAERECAKLPASDDKLKKLIFQLNMNQGTTVDKQYLESATTIVRSGCADPVGFMERCPALQRATDDQLLAGVERMRRNYVAEKGREMSPEQVSELKMRMAMLRAGCSQALEQLVAINGVSRNPATAAVVGTSAAPTRESTGKIQKSAEDIARICANLPESDHDLFFKIDGLMKEQGMDRTDGKVDAAVASTRSMCADPAAYAAAGH